MTGVWVCLLGHRTHSAGDKPILPFVSRSPPKIDLRPADPKEVFFRPPKTGRPTYRCQGPKKALRKGRLVVRSLDYCCTIDPDPGAGEEARAWPG